MKKILAAAVLTVCGSVNATVVNWGNHDPVEVQFMQTLGTFTDYVEFQLSGNTPSFDVLSTVVSNNLGNGSLLNITNGKYSVWSEGADNVISNDDTKLTQDWSFNGQSGNVTNNVLLVPGDYYYKITGNGNGLYGGNYVIASAVTPVPEPDTYALILAGLGAMLFVNKRRVK